MLPLLRAGGQVGRCTEKEKPCLGQGCQGAGTKLETGPGTQRMKQSQGPEEQNQGKGLRLKKLGQNKWAVAESLQPK